MSEIRYILCESPFQLVAMGRLLGRAIAAHLSDWAVFINPDPLHREATLYRPGQPPLALTLAVTDMITKVVNTDIAPLLAADPNPPRAVHCIVAKTVDDGALAGFLDNGNDPKFFHVWTPVVPYGNGPFVPPANKEYWLRPNVGRYMPAIRLPDQTIGHAGPIMIYPIGQAWNIPNPPERDACRLRLKPQDVADADAQTILWSDVPEALRNTFERWARTVTFRRVGIVVSGGGASVFRLVQFFYALENKKLPIDMLAGVSGGTVFAAAYAFGGMPAIQSLIAQGNLITATVTAGLITSWVIQEYFDNFFGRCGVRNTEIRVLPISTSFPPLKPPNASAIVDGTFGQAVRASGGAPFFGPYFPNNGDTRQVDGGIKATLPPPLVAERFGADLIFAANVIAPPSTRFVGEDKPILGPLLTPLYRYTPLGRVADMWGSFATMLHAISEASGLDADDFLDTEARNGALIEPFTFYNLPQLVDDGIDIPINQKAQDWFDLWRTMD